MYHNQLAVAVNLDACQRMANETSNRLILQFTPSAEEWQVKCGLYASKNIDLNDALRDILQQRDRFNANPPIEEKRQ